jgi:phosphoesterase RecJ-like protein
MYDKIKSLVEEANNVLIIQADNPDGDSLGSAIALEEILGDMGKDVYLYCAVDMPGYLHYLEGWSRIRKELPSSFDLSIIVDTSTETLLEKLEDDANAPKLKSTPCIVLDHHQNTDNVISYATELVNRPDLSSTGELVFEIAKNLSWGVSIAAGEAILVAILGDTQGLSNNHAYPSTYRTVADITEIGVSRPALEDKRKQYSKMPPEIFKYKAKLIETTELLADGQLALVIVPHQDIMTYSPLYNPAAIIQFDMLQTVGVCVSVVMKSYDDGKITGSIRSNEGHPVAGDLASHFGGGGHAQASGFKITGGKTVNEVKKELISKVTALLKANRLK